MCEKAHDHDSGEAIELESLVKKNKLTFALTHTYTGYPMVRQMRELIASGSIGNLYSGLMAQYYQGWVNQLSMGPAAGITVSGGSDPKQSGSQQLMGDIGLFTLST